MSLLVSRQQASRGLDRTFRTRSSSIGNDQGNMSLIICPDCQHEVSDAAKACIYCGRPLAVPAQPSSVEARHQFFPVAAHKFIVLSVCTLNIYTLYWCYQNWWRIRERTGEQLSPFWRAFFAPLWAFSLFARIARQAGEHGVTVGWSPTLLGLAYLIMSGFGMLPDPLWLVTLASFLPFLPVVQTIQRLNQDEAATESRNAAYSGANVATIMVGGIIVLLAILGTFMSPGEDEQEFEPLPEATGWTSSRPGAAAHAGYFTG